MLTLAQWLEEVPHNAGSRRRTIVLRFTEGAPYTGEDRHEAWALEGPPGNPYIGDAIGFGKGTLLSQALDDLEAQMRARGVLR